MGPDFGSSWLTGTRTIEVDAGIPSGVPVQGCGGLCKPTSKAVRKYCTSILSTFLFHLFSFLGVIFFIMNMIHYWDNSKHLIMLANYLDIVQVLTYVNSFIYLFIEV